MKVYLDNSATTRQYDEVTEYMYRIMKEEFGNPSSLHSMGVAAEKIVKEGRKKPAEALGLKPEEIIFTSGGTEANNMAILGGAESKKRGGNRIITSKVEHPSVLESMKLLEKSGYEVVYIDVDKQGCLDLTRLEEAITEKTIIISVMAVNNEVGTLQPIEEIGKIKSRYNQNKGTKILFHCDGVQCFGKYRIPIGDVDMMSVSAHKIHGPKGMGALYLRKNLKIAPLIIGGGQEKGRRSGTENVPAIGGFGKAVELSYGKLASRVEKMDIVRARFIEGLSAEIPDIKINSPMGSATDWASGQASIAILNVSFMGVRAEVLLHSLEQDGIYVSTGSACSSNKKGQSHVLKAMGLKDNEIEGAIRFSFSEFNSLEEAEYVIDKIKGSVARMRKLGSFR